MLVQAFSIFDLLVSDAGEVLDEMRLFEGAVEGRMIRQLQDDELVSKVAHGLCYNGC